LAVLLPKSAIPYRFTGCIPCVYGLTENDGETHQLLI